MGTHFRVNIIGKPSVQYTDNKHYVALRYVGVSGASILHQFQEEGPHKISKSQLQFCLQAAKLLQNPDDEETDKVAEEKLLSY